MALHDRSECPLNRAVEVLGDRWSLLLLRDIAAVESAHFRALRQGSREGISASVLAARLQALVENGLLRRERCPGHRQRISYRLTEAGRELTPVIDALAAWARRYCCEGAGTGAPGEGRKPHEVRQEPVPRVVDASAALKRAAG